MRLILFFISLTFTSLALKAQNTGYIYGTVTTIDGKEYEGAIRWDDEEVFWSDHFNSVKTTSEYHQYIEDEGIITSIQKWFSWDDHEGHDDGHDKNVTIVRKNIKDIAHVWVCHFGDLQSLQVSGGEEVILTLKNGDNVAVKGGSNDINTKIKVLSEDFGELIIDWDRIRKVDFKNAPSGLDKVYGEPLYGTVKTTRGEFTGYLQWDHDERLSNDNLDGETVDGEVSLEFKNIKAITKKDNYSSEITLESGRTITLHASNDVNDENRGIIVNQPDLGRIDIKWDNFISASFDKKPNQKLLSYSDFKKPEKIRGTVSTNDSDRYMGTLVYDLDEEYNFEFIQGKNNDGLEYSIPLKHIKKLSPFEGNKTIIALNNGQEVILGGTHDVSEYNSGVLVFRSDDEPLYIKWSNVNEIVLNH